MSESLTSPDSQKATSGMKVPACILSLSQRPVDLTIEERSEEPSHLTHGAW